MSATLPAAHGQKMKTPAGMLAGMFPYFDPPLTGVYLQVGARPVALTVQWITHGRPDPMGKIPAAAGSETAKPQ